MAEAHGRYIG